LSKTGKNKNVSSKGRLTGGKEARSRASRRRPVSEKKGVEKKGKGEREGVKPRAPDMMCYIRARARARTLPRGGRHNAKVGKRARSSRYRVVRAVQQVRRLPL